MLTASMLLGSAMTVFAAEGDSETPSTTPGSVDGTGTYEGGEMKYPTLSVTLPTIPSGTYDYIADPNGLIAATDNAKYAGATFDENAKGIFFLTDSDAKTYSAKSSAQKVVNENAQDIDVTIKLTQKAAGDTSIEYANSDTFATDDTANKLYLAITNDDSDSTKLQTAALSATTVATLTTKVDGVKANFEGKYTEGTGYGYVKKADDALTDWNDCSYIMTGALNENASWGDNLTFPTITVTWSYAEHVDAVEAHGSVTNGTLWMAKDSSTGFSERPSSLKVDGVEKTDYSFNSKGWISMTAPASGSVILITVGDTTYKVTVS